MFDGFPVPDFDFDELRAGRFEQVPVSIFLTNDDHVALKGDPEPLELESTVPLSSTSNSAVYVARSQSGARYAVKITPHKRREINEFRKQQEIVSSPYLVRSLSIRESPTKAMLQMELCECGDVSRFTWKSEGDVRQLIHDVAVGLSLLHVAGWMHLDVSPGNILVTQQMFKLGDFGTLLRVGQFEEGCEGAGPYVSPEALAFPDCEFGVGPSTDVFSFGVVLLEVASGCFAPRGGSDNYSALRRGELRLGMGRYQCQWSTNLRELINAMLDPNPRRRPTAREIVDAISGDM